MSAYQAFVDRDNVRLSANGSGDDSITLEELLLDARWQLSMRDTIR